MTTRAIHAVTSRGATTPATTNQTWFIFLSSFQRGISSFFHAGTVVEHMSVATKRPDTFLFPFEVMPHLCKAVITAGYLYILIAIINASPHLIDNDDPTVNIKSNDNNNNINNNNNYLKRQLQKFHWRQYQLQQQQQRKQQQGHTEILELPRPEPLLEKSQEIASNSGRTRSRTLGHHSRSSSSSSSSRHRLSLSDVFADNGPRGNQSRNAGSQLLLQDREMRIEVFEDIIDKLLEMSRDDTVQRIPFSSGMLSLVLDPSYYEFLKEGTPKPWQQLLQEYLQQQQQQQQPQQLNEQAHKKPRPAIYVCPKTDSSFKLACPGLDPSGATICIQDMELCDGTVHCPKGEDENSTVCMFYTMIRYALNKMTETLFENLPRK